MINVENRMLFAIPKKGRLYEQCAQYLKRIGLSFRKRDRHDIALCANMDIAIVFLPAKDIALYVGSGKVDLAITGLDIVEESGLSDEIDVKLPLGFGKCSLSLAVPKVSGLALKDFENKRVVTSFPNLTKRFFEDAGLKNVQVSYVSGSVEIACALGAAEGITDLVQTGDTIKEAGLVVIEEIFKTQAALIAKKDSTHKDLIEKLYARIQGIVYADDYALMEYNVKRENLNKCVKLTPGLKSPTIMPLDDNNWVAVKSVVKRKESNELADKLKSEGAFDILITVMENYRM